MLEGLCGELFGAFYSQSSLSYQPLHETLPSSEDKGTIYFYRIEEVGRFQGNKPKVYLNDNLILMVPESEFIGLRLAPGKHIVRMSGKRTETLVNVKANQTYYVRVSRVGDGFSGMRDSLYLESEEQAIFQMRQMKLLGDKNIKDKSKEWLKIKPSSP